MTKILICGSRLERKGARAVVENILARYNPKTDTVIQGGAPGVDAVAAAVAQAAAAGRPADADAHRK